MARFMANPKVVFEWDGQEYRMRTETLPGVTLEQQTKLLHAVQALNGWEETAATVRVHVRAVHLELLTDDPMPQQPALPEEPT